MDDPLLIIKGLNMKLTTLFTTIIFYLFFTATCYAISQEQQSCELNGINYTQAKSLTQSLKAALKEDDIQTIANLISYPLRINTSANGKATHYFMKNKNEFIQKYNALFTESMKKSILDDNSLFCNYKGAMLGAGTVWFTTDDAGTKIFSINLSQ
jgi:hypothetical protein